MSLMNILLVFLVLIVLALAGFILSLRRKIGDSQKQGADQKNIDIISNITNQIQQLSQNFSQNMGTIQKSVDQRLGENTDRLDNASKSYAEVRSQLAKLEEQTQKVFEASKDISSLHDILNAPKLRGVMGEFMLENLLSQKLSKNLYTLQYSFKSGEKVDVVVRLKDYLIPIDSKFPLENFRKIIEADDDAQKDVHKKQFYSDVKKHVDAIAQKYILPNEGTSDFAFMYIPAENVYYEIISHDFGNKNLFDYAKEKGVIPVSPNIFNAYLGTIVMGLSGMKIAENAKAIFKNIKNLELYFGKIRGDFLSLGTHIKNAHNKYELTDRRMEKFQMELEKTKDKELEVVSENIKLPEVKINQDADKVED
ncbi:MAG: DNA recombination protein RmuC [Parcubacteria group bacterium]|jgi:DNA recombination protein RmuC